MARLDSSGNGCVVGYAQGSLRRVFEIARNRFVPGPLEEERRDKIVERTDRSVRVRSFTALRQQIEDRSQKGLVLKMRGGPDAKLTITLRLPSEQTLTTSFRDLPESIEGVGSSQPDGFQTALYDER